MASVPGSTPTSCISSAHISAPTTAAALLRVTVERRTAKAAIPASGSTYSARLPASRATPCAADTGVPESDVSGWKPHAMLPATVPTIPIANTITRV